MWCISDTALSSAIEIAKNLNVDHSTVCRTIELFNITGNVKKAEYPKGQKQKLFDTDALVIIQVVLERPGIYLHEVQQYLLEETGMDVSLSTNFNFLHKERFNPNPNPNPNLTLTLTLTLTHHASVTVNSRL